MWGHVRTRCFPKVWTATHHLNQFSYERVVEEFGLGGTFVIRDIGLNGENVPGLCTEDINKKFRYNRYGNHILRSYI